MMLTNRRKNAFAAFLVLMFSFSGCGDSPVSTVFKLSAEVSEAYTTLLEANVEKQTGMYNIIAALSNDYGSDFLELIPTDHQLDAIEEELMRMAELAPDVINALDVLEQAAAAYPEIVSALLENGASGVNPLLAFFESMMDFPDERKNEFLMVVYNLSITEQINLYYSLPADMQALATDPYDFYRKVEAGELNDVICAIIAAVQINVSYFEAAAALQLSRPAVVIQRGLRMVMVGINVMISINLDGNANDLVRDSLQDEMETAFRLFWQNKNRVLNPATDTSATNLESAIAVALAISQQVSDVMDVVDANNGDIVIGNNDNFEIDITGQLEGTRVSTAALLEEMTDAILTVGQFLSVYTLGDNLPDNYGAVMLGYEDETDVDGFVVAQQTVNTTVAPEWVLGLGGGDPTWNGALPSVQWIFTVVNTAGEQSSSQTETVSEGSSTPVKTKRKKKSDHKDDGTWFDGVADGTPPIGSGDDDDSGDDSDGGGSGSNDGSCDSRAYSDGTCVDYIGMSSEVMNNMRNGCQGTFSSTLCSTAGISFTCAMDVSGYGESYQIRAHVYNTDNMPPDIQQTMCNTTCMYFEDSEVQITNCRPE